MFKNNMNAFNDTKLHNLGPLIIEIRSLQNSKFPMDQIETNFRYIEICSFIN